MRAYGPVRLAIAKVKARRPHGWIRQLRVLGRGNRLPREAKGYQLGLGKLFLDLFFKVHELRFNLRIDIALFGEGAACETYNVARASPLLHAAVHFGLAIIHTF